MNYVERCPNCGIRWLPSAVIETCEMIRQDVCYEADMCCQECEWRWEQKEIRGWEE